MEKVTVLLFIGQSNMQGSTGEKCTAPAANNCLEYKFLTDELVALKNPVGEDIGEGAILRESALKNGSLVPFFSETYATLSGKKVIAIHTAKGNTKISEWLPDTERFPIMLNKITAGLKKISESYEIEKTFVVFLQGESNALIQTSEKDYRDMLIMFKNALKSSVDFDKFAIIRVGYFAEFAPWIKLPKKIKKKADKVIMKAQENAVKVDPDFIILTRILKKLSRRKKYLNPKEYGPHYNNEAMKIIGNIAGSKLYKITRK